MKKPVFEGVATALVTPFDQGTLDFTVMNQLLDLQLAAGVDAVVVCGTTGEASTMTDNERLALIAHTVKYCAGRCRVIAGTGTNDTAHTLQLSRVAASMGADAVLLVTPYYNKCTQAGLVAHYTAAADCVPCPVIVYNVPSRTGVDISVETCRALAEHPNIGGIKEASGSVPKAMRILDTCAEELPLWSGNDDLTVPLLSIGAKGVISVLSNVRPKLTMQMVRACQAGEFAQAGRMQTDLMPLIDALFCEVNPIPVKQALTLEGIPAGLPRLPLTLMPVTQQQCLQQGMEYAAAAPKGRDAFWALYREKGFDAVVQKYGRLTLEKKLIYHVIVPVCKKLGIYQLAAKIYLKK